MQPYSNLFTPAILVALLSLSFGCSPSSAPDTASEAPSTTEAIAPVPAVTEVPDTATEPTPASERETPDTITLPPHLRKLGQARGDLNKDGQDEMVLAVEHLDKKDEYDYERSVQVYRLNKGNWELWEDIAGGLLGSGDGGMMGDPFEAITIERGVIVIEHFGGSRQKWSYVHRFRYQHNDWELIGATITFGAVCETWHTYDYNLSTSTIAAEQTSVDCETDEDTTEKYTFKHMTSPLPRLKGFTPGSNQVILPDSKGDFYY